VGKSWAFLKQALEANGTVMPGGIEQAVKVEMEANSCAEFGYEGVYLD